ncbi:uncharacterized protein LOC134216154 [Armigeres subalbatus]|uniref:uncharacterized protein LOC134216154 n=1 Tax=Armigeres subalbatus TaxID=124917 RepID=UPI002ED2DCFF
MKSCSIVVLVLGILVAAILCAPATKTTASDVICDKKGCTFPVKDYGPVVTPHIPTMQPRVRTMLVPPLWVNTTWLEIVESSSTTFAPEEDGKESLIPFEDTTYDDNDEDNVIQE